ncbi:MAG: FAD-binding oxidoreductase [Rhodobacteraceae bacterium]|nr:MAG: FAD-binding oxidoreductase [Paracoccaceae bacterium]
MAETADVLVIGGGIAGVGAASEIAAGAQVTVLEREDAIGRHATGRSAAMFILNYGGPALRILTAASEAALVEPDPAFADGPVLSPRGELLVADADETAALDAYLDGATGAEEIAPDDAVGLVPILRRDRIARAMWEPSARDIDVDRLLQLYARKARAGGARVATGAEVRAIARTGDVWRVETAAGAFEAPVIVNAAGAWADETARMAGVRPVGLRPLRRSAAIIPAPAGHDVRGWPMVGSAGETWYARPDAGRLMVSPADEDPVEPCDAWPDDMVLAEGLHRFEEATTVPVTRVERSWAGLRTFSPDRTPVAGWAPDAEGFLWLAGQGGYGIQTSPALSRLAADFALGRAPMLAAATLAALSPSRFTAA